MTPQVGSLYTLIEPIGAGGMATIYKALDNGDGTFVAIKLLHAELSANPEIRRRFIQEAKIQVALDHQNIVKVFHSNGDEPQPYIAMEFIDGLSLDRVLARRRKLPVDDMLHIFGQVLSALHYAHAHGVIHRDIKPGNVMITPLGNAKVTDFGIAKIAGDLRLTKTGTGMGSAAYMSPEQILGIKSIDGRTDIYSLGIAIFESLTGRLPFENPDTDGVGSDFPIRAAHVNTPAPDVCLFAPEVSKYISACVSKSMNKDPAKRYQNCQELLEALHKYDHPGSLSLHSKESSITFARSGANQTAGEDKTTRPPLSHRMRDNGMTAWLAWFFQFCFILLGLVLLTLLFK
jgi:serine/threonine protein kinase